jgi:phage shock protein B
VVRLKGGGSIRQGEPLNADETRLIQELHQGMARMEKRVEALETILMDREAHHEKEGKQQ